MKDDTHYYITKAYQFWIGVLDELELDSVDYDWLKYRLDSVMVKVVATNREYQTAGRGELDPAVTDEVELISRLLKRWKEACAAPTGAP